MRKPIPTHVAPIPDYDCVHDALELALAHARGLSPSTSDRRMAAEALVKHLESAWVAMRNVKED